MHRRRALFPLLQRAERWIIQAQFPQEPPMVTTTRNPNQSFLTCLKTRALPARTEPRVNTDRKRTRQRRFPMSKRAPASTVTCPRPQSLNVNTKNNTIAVTTTTNITTGHQRLQNTTTITTTITITSPLGCGHEPPSRRT